ncbi:hypothetical protein CXF86_19850 [Shewanella sp. GutCb]|uniref:hypothetical protein n=1 Tax=Shewanella sp. GutCb TaxID=2058315 RepID=UPI000C7E6EA7|nr:hypothetical protein [Shewanella sp. GutCb]PKG73021.1 hypothetical protein CXF86_19850 [Shewanella sp. GutCb]
MFTFTPKRLVKNWPAIIKMSMDGGKVEEVEISLDLNLLPVDDYMTELSEGDHQLFDAILAGFDGIAGIDKQPLADTPDNRAALYQHAPFTDALLHAYRAANSGEAARKN